MSDEAGYATGPATLPLRLEVTVGLTFRFPRVATLVLGGAVALSCTKPSEPQPAAAAAAPEAAQATEPAKPAEPAPPPAPKSDAEKTVVDVAIGSKDHTTLVAAVKAADLVVSLSSPGGAYTVFAPTNAAFDKLPKGTVEELLKPEKKGDLTAILKHHAAVPILKLSDLKDGQVVAMSDGQKVTIHVQGDKVMVENATILASVPAMNGVVHVIDTVLLPTPAK